MNHELVQSKLICPNLMVLHTVLDQIQQITGTELNLHILSECDTNIDWCNTHKLYKMNR